jgi:hypothetical protein
VMLFWLQMVRALSAQLTKMPTVSLVWEAVWSREGNPCRLVLVMHENICFFMVGVKVMDLSFWLCLLNSVGIAPCMFEADDKCPQECSWKKLF